MVDSEKRTLSYFIFFVDFNFGEVLFSSSALVLQLKSSSIGYDYWYIGNVGIHIRASRFPRQRALVSS